MTSPKLTKRPNELVGQSYEAYFDLIRKLESLNGTRRMSPMEAEKIIRKYWQAPENQRAREQVATPAISRAHHYSEVLHHIEDHKDLLEHFLQGAAAHHEVWSLLKDYILENFQTGTVIQDHHREMLEFFIQTPPPKKGRGQPETPGDYFKKFQLACCVGAVRRILGYPLTATPTNGANALLVVSQATKESFDIVKEAWKKRRKSIPLNIRGE